MDPVATPEKEFSQTQAANELFGLLQQGLQSVGLSFQPSVTEGQRVIYVVTGPAYDAIIAKLSADDQKGYMNFELCRWTQEDEWRHA